MLPFVQCLRVPTSPVDGRPALLLWWSLKAPRVFQATAFIPTYPSSGSKPPQRTEAQIEWEYATRIERVHPLIDQLTAVLSKAYSVTVDADEVFVVGGAIAGETP